MKTALGRRGGGAAALFLVFLLSGKAAAGNNGDNNKTFSVKDVKGTFSFRLVPAKSFAADRFAGGGDDPSGLASAPRQDVLRGGVFTADGKGNITAGHTKATTDTNTGATLLIDFTWTGTYTVNADGTGTLSIADPPQAAQTCTDTTLTSSSPGPCASDEEGAETYAIVVNRHGENKIVSLIETDNIGGGAKIFLTGEAQQQGD